MEQPENTTEIRRKRLQWRASRRGIKEMDLVVGGYAQAHLATMNLQELDAFEMVLDLPDTDLLAWMTGQAAVPAAVSTPMLARVLKFRPVETSQT